MSSKEQQSGGDFGQGQQKKEWRPRDVWAFRIVIGGTILTLLTLGALAFGAVAIPTVLLGGGALLLFSPVLLGIAAITSPIWVPIGGLLLITPPILGALAVGAIALGLVVYWVWNFIRSRRTREAATDLLEGAKDATRGIQYGAQEAAQKAQQAREQARQRAQQATGQT
ncbi:hypothetical protein KFL_001770030 [Klebsormidium nitens]|uniref:Oleosin n=1 Tax=Klebsormidium nitens TaxID=105231 RepID=A0A1Y1I7N5_KLENI|nr:hypothetical protein KFL_001770030 [Klebsormidium nitens]|eukprot:GAQ84118.1 hypothetical protein KFL_001770030 [Klebsormidium nitens]